MAQGDRAQTAKERYHHWTRNRGLSHDDALEAMVGEAVNADGHQVAGLRRALWDIAVTFKRGTPIGHLACSCEKCTALYDAIRKVQVYELPDRPSQVAP